MAEKVADNPDSRSERANAPAFFRLLRLLRPYWGLIAVGMVALLLSVPGELFPALVWKYVTDDLCLRNSKPTPVLPWLFSLGGRIHRPLHLLASCVVWMFFVYETGELLGTVSANIMNRVAQKFIFTLRNRVYHKLQSQSLGYLQRQHVGDLISRAMGDVEEIQSFIVNSIDQIIGEGILWSATVVLLVLMDWRVASVSLLPLVLVYILLKYFNARIRPIYTGARERLGDVTTRLQENLSGVVVIKIFGREKQEEDRFRDATDGYYRQQIKAINARSVFFSFTRSVGFFSNIFMLGMGGYLILTNGGFTIGKLIAFRAYWWRLYGPVQTLARVNDMMQRALAAARRVFEILDAPEELPNAPDHPADQSHRRRNAVGKRHLSLSRRGQWPRIAHRAARSVAADCARPDRGVVRPQRFGQKHGA